MQELSASTNRFGDYILHDRIGAGGMAEIFLATATGIEGFEKRVVIKRILPSLSDDEQFVRMFIEEAKLCVALRHPNIVQVHDLGEIDAQYYIAMEYVDGRDLLKTLAACGKKKIGFPTDIALFIIMEVLKGLHYAHQLKKPNGEPLGIIHRDVSPSNVLLSFEGEVKIGDFGIAKANTREKTATGILKGKFGYMAPEQVTGVPIDSRADVFAVGIVMYELLTGHRLFAGKNDLAVLEKVRDARIEPPPRHYRGDLDGELEHLVLRALSRDARDRFQTAQDLHDAIHDYVYRSRASVGPAHLARFMQTLFLNDPEEIDRRTRVRLPQPRAFPVVPMSSIGSNGFNGANGAAKNSRTLELLTNDDFDEKTPLLDPEELPGGRPLSAVAFVSDVDSWERAGSSALIEYARSDSDPERQGRSRPPPVPPRTHVRAEGNELVPSAESTARTDVEIDFDASQIQIDDSGKSPQARVAALRAAVENDSPTDLDLSEDSRLDKKSLPRPISTVFGRRPTPDRNESQTRTEVEESGDQIRQILQAEEDDDTTQKRPDDDYDAMDHDPSDIVERTYTTSEEYLDDDPEQEEETAAGEPTVRFDSANARYRPQSELEDPATTTSAGLFSEDRTSDSDAEETAREREHYENEDDEPSASTLQMEEADLPTAEVPEHELRAGSIVRSETDTVPAPMRSKPDTEMESSRTDIQLEPPLVSPILDDDDIADRTESDLDPPSLVVRPRAGSLFDEATSANDAMFETELDGHSEHASVSSAQRAVAEIRRARRVSRMANELAKEEMLLGPSRRRPITSRRPRPLLLPAEDEDQPKLTPNPRMTSGRPPRRRETATRSISIVNPRQNSIRRQPIVQAKVREDSFGSDTTGAGPLVDEETQSGEMAAVMPEPLVDPPRRRSSGVAAALSEAAVVDDEIEQIRKSTSRGRPPDDETSPDVIEDDEELDPAFDEEDTKQGVKVKEAIRRIQSRKRIVTQNFVLYGDKRRFEEESEPSVRIITSAGRLEDEGASDLFGVLGVLDNGTLDEASFEPEEEVSLETDAKNDYGSGATRLGLLAREESTDGEMFGEESTASVTDADVLSISKLIRNSSVPLEPDIMEMAAEESGISISLDPSDDDDDINADPMERSGFEFEFTDNEEPTEEQSDPERKMASVRSKSILDTPAGIPLFDDTSHERPARLISDSFELEKGPEPKIEARIAKADTRAKAPVRPVSMAEPPDGRTGNPDELVAPSRAKGSKESHLRRVVQRHKVAKEVRARGSAGEVPSPAAASFDTSPAPPVPAPAKASRAAPSAGQFYPPVQHVEVRGTGALNKFATFAVLIAVLLAVAAAVSILLQNRPRAIPPISDATEIKPAKAPTTPPAPPPAAPPVQDAKPPPQDVKPPPKEVKPPPVAPPPPVVKKEVKPPPPIAKTEPPPAKKKPAIAPPPPVKKKKRARSATDKGVLRISCEQPIDIKISSIGTVKAKTKYGRQLKPGDYRITLISGTQRKSYDIILVPGDPVVIRCPF